MRGSHPRPGRHRGRRPAGADRWAGDFLAHHATATRLSATGPGGEAVGFVGLERNKPSEGIGTIVLIGVRPEFRGRGYGSRLVDAAYRTARAGGLRGVRAYVDVDNGASLAALSRHGASANAIDWHSWVYVR